VKKLKSGAGLGSPLPNAGEGVGVRGNSTVRPRVPQVPVSVAFFDLAQAKRSGMHRPLTPGFSQALGKRDWSSSWLMAEAQRWLCVQ
jgi:hypothetical protein